MQHMQPLNYKTYKFYSYMPLVFLEFDFLHLYRHTCTILQFEIIREFILMQLTSANCVCHVCG